MENLNQLSVQASNFRGKVERLSILAGDFISLLKEMRREYYDMQSPIHRNTYNLLLSSLATEIISSHPDEKEMFMNERFLATISDILQRKLAIKLKTPGQIWDSSITNNVCKMLTSTPAEERKVNKDFLKCVSELPAHHPLRAGPGSWHSIHVMALEVKSVEDHLMVCKFIRIIQNHFYCSICKEHFGKYLEENPPERLLKPPRNNIMLEARNVDTGETIIVPKLFEWTVTFHNKVNEHRHNYRGSSSQLSLSLFQAYKIYSTDSYETCPECKVSK
jgi:hypothetical protein